MTTTARGRALLKAAAPDPLGWWAQANDADREELLVAMLRELPAGEAAEFVGVLATAEAAAVRVLLGKRGDR